MHATENAVTPADPIDGVLAKIQPTVTNRQEYCDHGPHAGMWLVHLGDIYLTEEEARAIDGLATTHARHCTFIVRPGKKACDGE